jgi:hypothetical protein
VKRTVLVAEVCVESALIPPCESVRHQALFDRAFETHHGLSRPVLSVSIWTSDHIVGVREPSPGDEQVQTGLNSSERTRDDTANHHY